MRPATGSLWPKWVGLRCDTHAHTLPGICSGRRWTGTAIATNLSWELMKLKRSKLWPEHDKARTRKRNVRVSQFHRELRALPLIGSNLHDPGLPRAASRAAVIRVAGRGSAMPQVLQAEARKSVVLAAPRSAKVPPRMPILTPRWGRLRLTAISKKGRPTKFLTRTPARSARRTLLMPAAQAGPWAARPPESGVAGAAHTEVSPQADLTAVIAPLVVRRTKVRNS